jgi:transcriptional regulator with XRE-family HTH domain
MRNDLVSTPSVRAVAALLRDARDAAVLTQAELAERAGVAASTVSAYESGRHASSLAVLDRLFGALRRRLRVEAEPVDGEVDALIDAASAESMPERLRRLTLILPYLLDELADVPFVADGAFAAFVQGAPVPVEALDIVVADGGLDALAVALSRARAARWSEQRQSWGYGNVDPRDGTPRWRTSFGEIRLRVVDRLPNAVEVTVGDRRVAVRPMVELDADDPAVQRILDRLRQRIGSPA